MSRLPSFAQQFIRKFSRNRAFHSCPILKGQNNTFNDYFEEALKKASELKVPEETKLEFVKTILSGVISTEKAQAETKIARAEAEAKIARAETETETKVARAETETKVARAEAEAETETKVARAETETERYKWRLETAVKDLLQSKGLMTSRGIYESLLKAVAVELKSPKAKNPPKCTEVCEKVAEMVGNNEIPVDPNSSLTVLYTIFSECNVNTIKKGRLTYDEVSNDIHGYPWSGDAVKVFTSKMSNDSQLKCVVLAVAWYHHFESVEL